MKNNAPVSQGLENFLKYLRDTQMEYRVALDVEREADNKSNDFNHAIEFGGYDPRRAATILKKYRAVRQDRRKAKQLIETTGLLDGWCSQNQAVDPFHGKSTGRNSQGREESTEQGICPANRFYGGDK